MRAALLEAAAELLEAEGPDALSVRRIAAAAGVAPMGVYNHFESKFGIVEALFVDGFRRLSDAITSIPRSDDPLEDLRESGRRYRALALAHPMIYRVMFLRVIPGFEPSD
ncbi:MAG TPA: TetR/AcrR family transcriptional regulator, partial [Acidimicrobiales bacterium]